MKLFKEITTTVLVCAFGLWLNHAHASDRTEPKVKFTENLGQLINSNQHEVNSVEYYASTAYGDYYLHSNKISFVAREKKCMNETDFSEYRAHRVDIEWIGGNMSPEILALDPFADVSHIYRGKDGLESFSDIHHFNELLYKDVYEHIDLKVYDVNGHFKYDFIVHPGGNPKDIVLSVSEDQFETAEDQLTVESSLGELISGDPFTYQVENGVKKSVSAQYTLGGDGNVVFSIGSYNEEVDLIIDPSVEWSLAFGGNDDDYATGMDMDSEGNLYVTGYMTSTSFPSTLGLSTVQGNSDAYITKFDPDGNLIWSLLFGGTQEDESQAIAIDKNDMIYIAGKTTNAYDFSFPVTVSTWLHSITGVSAGSEDLFLAKFNTSGILDWSVGYGGSTSDEFASGLGIDAENNVLVVANHSNVVNPVPPYGLLTFPEGTSVTNTYSPPGYPSFGGEHDILILKFNSLGNRLWATSFGQDDIGLSPEEVGNAVATDDDGNVFIVGGCIQGTVGDYSWLSNVNTTYAHTTGTSTAGLYDVLIVKFNSDGVYQWLIQHGSEEDDQAMDVDINWNNEVVLTGYSNTASAVDFNATNTAVYNAQTGEHGFLMKYSNSGSIQEYCGLLDITNSSTPSNITRPLAIKCFEDKVGITGLWRVRNSPFEFDDTWFYYSSGYLALQDPNQDPGKSNTYVHLVEDEGSDFGVLAAYVYGGRYNGYGTDVLIDNCNVFIVGVTEGVRLIGPGGFGFEVTNSNYVSVPTDLSAYSFLINFDTEFCNGSGTIGCGDCLSNFSPYLEKNYTLSAWVKEDVSTTADVVSYASPQIKVNYLPGTTFELFTAEGPIIDGWQRIEKEFDIPTGTESIQLELVNASTENEVYFDDVRVFPSSGNMKSFVYDPETLRLMAEMDENNYATRYEYDLEGKLIRIKKDTEHGIQTIQETNSNLAK